MQYIKEITVDLSGEMYFNYITAVQGDDSSRAVKITILSSGAPFTPPAGSTAVLRCRKPDGTFVFNSATINGDGTITAVLTENMLASVGNCRCEVALYDSDTSLTTVPFIVKVTPGAVDPSVQSTDEYTALQEALAKIDTAAGVADAALADATAALDQLDDIESEIAEHIEDAEDATERANAAAERAEQAIIIETVKVNGRPLTPDANHAVNVTYPERIKTASGSIATFEDAFAGTTLRSIIASVVAAQSGSGNPSPTNIRPISGYTGITVNHSGEDTSEPTQYAISFPADAGTVYGGIVDIKAGTLTVTHALIDLGDLETPQKPWRTITQSGHYWFWHNGSPSFPMKNHAQMICSHYTQSGEGVSQPGSYLNCQDKECGWVYDTSIAIRDDSYPNTEEGIAAFAAAMDGVKMVYELATSIEYQLTPQTIAALSGVNNIWASTGDIAVIYEANHDGVIDAIKVGDEIARSVNGIVDITEAVLALIGGGTRSTTTPLTKSLGPQETELPEDDEVTETEPESKRDNADPDVPDENEGEMKRGDAKFTELG